MKKTEAAPRWTFDFTRFVRCSPSFLRSMDVQLTRAFRETTGLDLSGFLLAPAYPDKYTVRRDGVVGFVQVDLVANSNLGFPVALAWMDRQQRRFIEPTEDVTEEDVTFWWHGLPVDQLVAEQETWPDPPFDPRRFSFAIDYKLKIWPHVRFTIAFHAPIDEARRAALDERFFDVVNEWLATGKPGTIHESGIVARIDDRTVELPVDLGSAGPEGMVYVLEQFEAFGGVASVKIRAGG